jgi:beta-alanine--pyruvate transaminase
MRPSWPGRREAVQLFHGYTYSGHPLACAAGLAALDAYQQEGIFAQAAAVAPHWEAALHALRDAPHVADIRTIGLLPRSSSRPVPARRGRGPRRSRIAASPKAC